MKLFKKLSIVLLSLICVVACAFGAAACFNFGGNKGNKKDDDTDNVDTTFGHTFAEGWTGDADYHWHAATDGSDATDGKALHDWVKDDTQGQAATCLSSGNAVYVCSVCKETKTVKLTQLSHDWEVETVQPTCTSSGYTHKYCKNDGCNAKLTEYLDALGHDAGGNHATCESAAYCTRKGCNEIAEAQLAHSYVVVEETKADCTHNGHATYRCENGCNNSYETDTDKAKGHVAVWDAGETDYEGTAGVCYVISYTATCAVCEETVDTKTVTVTEHKYSTVISRAAKCNEAGEKALSCECGYSKTESYTDPDAHKWDGGVVSDGITTYTCANSAQHTKTSVVCDGTNATVSAQTLKQAGGITLADTSIQLDDGVKNKIGNSGDVALSADKLGLNDLNGVELEGTAESVVNKGTVYNLTLSVGGENVSDLGGKVTVTVPYTLEADDDPEHISIMYINGSKLVEIEGKYSDGFVIFETTHFSYYTVTRMNPAERCAIFGHALRNVKEDPTCLIPGYDMQLCTRCGHVEKVTIPALGHDWQEDITPATCSRNGLAEYECATCHVSYSVVIAAVGHSWEVEERVVATCLESGYTKYACGYCNEVYTITEAQKSHVFTSTVVAATCTESGHTHKVCINCALESDADYVEALGHSYSVKTVSPTCTVEGFTLRFCDRCGEEIEKTNPVPAKGHNLSNGVCTVCGAGCEHSYRAGTVVAATCTEGGYTVYNCSKCNSSYKGNITEALGHNYEVDECTRCHAVSPEAREYYLNLIQTTIEGSLSITITGVTFEMYENTTYDDGTSETRVYAEIEQLEVIKLTLSLSANGTVVGSGEGKIRETVDGDTVTVDCKLAVKDETVYLIADIEASEGIQGAPENVCGSVNFDYLFGGMSDGALSYADVKEYLVWYNTEAKSILDTFINENGEIASEIIRYALNNVCTRVSTANGYTYTLDFNKLAELNDTLKKLTAGEVAKELIGTEIYENLPELVEFILLMKPNDAITVLSEYGLSKTRICLAVDSLVYIATGKSISSEMMLEEMLNGEYADMTVADFIIANVNGSQGGGSVDVEIPAPSPVPDKSEKVRSNELEMTAEEFAAQVKEELRGLIIKHENITVYEIIAQYAGVYVGDIIQLVDRYVDTYLPYAVDGAVLSFSTDKTGNVTSAKIVADIDDMCVYEYEGYEYTEEMYVSVNGTVEFAFGAKATVDEGLIDEVVKSKLTFAPNQIITVYSNTDKTVYDRYTDIYSRIEGAEMRIHTDSKGNIVKIVVTRESVSRSIDRVESDFYYCWENREVYFYEIDLSKGVAYMTENGYCGDIAMISIAGLQTYTRDYTYSYKWIHRQTDTVITEQVRNKNSYEGQSFSGVTFYYDTAKGEYANRDPHYVSYDGSEYPGYGLKLSDKSKIECGGYYLYECDNCDYTYTRYIDHLSHYTVTKYELAPGSKSCDDGLIVKNVCPDCGETEYSYTASGHDHMFLIEEVKLATDTCNHSLYVYGCACGKYRFTNIGDKRWWGSDGYGNDWQGVINTEVHYTTDAGEGAWTWTRLYYCPVTGCGFNVLSCYDSSKDAHCYTTYYECVITGGDVDLEKGTVTGGKQILRLPYNYGYRHNNDVTTVETANGYKNTYKCTDCGLIDYVDEYTYDANGYEKTRTYTKYKDDPNDNTISNVDYYEYSREYEGEYLTKYTSITTHYNGVMAEANKSSVYEYIEIHAANGVLLEEGNEWSYYDKDGRYTNGSADMRTYTLNGDGEYATYTREITEYQEGRRISYTHKESDIYVYVDGHQFAMAKEYYETNDYFDKESGEYSETPGYWHRVEYDYEEYGYCTPVIYESTIYEDSPSRALGSVNHRFVGDYIVYPTCTQQGVSACVFCGHEVQNGTPYGHRYVNGVCVVCGLETENGYDGLVVFEDLSYTSETEYVIGYYNHVSSEFSIQIALVGEKNGEEEHEFLPDLKYNDTYNDNDYNYGSGKVTFSVAEVAAYAKESGFESYMVRVYFVPEYGGSQLDYSITVDAHDWNGTGTFTDLRYYDDKEPEPVQVKYCAECGEVLGKGYIVWQGVTEEEDGTYTYYGLNYVSHYERYDCTLTTSKPLNVKLHN